MDRASGDGGGAADLSGGADGAGARSEAQSGHPGAGLHALSAAAGADREGCAGVAAGDRLGRSDGRAGGRDAGSGKGWAEGEDAVFRDGFGEEVQGTGEPVSGAGDRRSGAGGSGNCSWQPVAGSKERWALSLQTRPEVSIALAGGSRYDTLSGELVYSEGDKVMSEEKQSSGFSWFLAGLGLGALIGVLYAPKAGRETREELASSAREGTEYLKQRGREAADQENTYVDRSKAQVSELIG